MTTHSPSFETLKDDTASVITQTETENWKRLRARFETPGGSALHAVSAFHKTDSGKTYQQVFLHLADPFAFDPQFIERPTELKQMLLNKAEPEATRIR